jgi:peroxiredoxin Q/BCP
MTLPVGTKAPDFELAGSAPKAVKLSDYKGQNVALVFYQVAFNFEDVDKMEAFRDLQPDFEDTNTQIIGVSIDPTGVCVAFSSTSNIDFPLLSDHMDHAVISSYDAWRTDKGYASVEGGIARQVAYLIDKDGIIKGVVGEDVAPKDQAAEALKLAKTLK